MNYALANSTENSSPLFQSIIHSLDYVSADYPGSVENGDVVDEAEFAEQLEIAQHALLLMQTLPDHPQKTLLIKQTEALYHAVQQKALAIEVTALCRDTIGMLISSYDVKVAPSVMPTLAAGQLLYEANCVSCHGLTGLGDGVQSVELTPKPANFHDRSRQENRNIYALFNTISLGVEGTAMPSFSHFTAAQRWELAFYISNFFATRVEVSRGEQLWLAQKFKNELGDVRQLSQAKPVDVRDKWGEDGLAVLTYLRSNPQALNTLHTPLDKTRNYLVESLSIYKEGNKKGAYEKALAAYFDGFELVEAKLKTVANDLRSGIESEMMQYRNMINDGVGVAQLESKHQSLLHLLDDAEKRLDASGTSSPSVTFITSMAILLREGLEAILVLAAIVSILIKANRRDALRYIHAGWIGALLMGLLTWYVATDFIVISGASRELTEGVTALVAAGMLIYIGVWLHSQSHAEQWQKFVRTKIVSSLSQSALWGLAFMAFVAVYREVFESVLFYQSLMLNSQPAQQRYVIAGIVVAAGLLVFLAWLVMRYSVRLPLRAFFRINMLLMFLLAMVFAGKGVVALQEAGTLPVSPVNFPQLDLLGIYPNLESLGLQLGLLCLVLIWAAHGYMKKNRESAAC